VPSSQVLELLQWEGSPCAAAAASAAARNASAQLETAAEGSNALLQPGQESGPRDGSLPLYTLPLLSATQLLLPGSAAPTQLLLTGSHVAAVAAAGGSAGRKSQTQRQQEQDQQQQQQQQMMLSGSGTKPSSDPGAGPATVPIAGSWEGAGQVGTAAGAVAAAAGAAGAAEPPDVQQVRDTQRSNSSGRPSSAEGAPSQGLAPPPAAVQDGEAAGTGDSCNSNPAAGPANGSEKAGPSSSNKEAGTDTAAAAAAAAAAGGQTSSRDPLTTSSSRGHASLSTGPTPTHTPTSTTHSGSSSRSGGSPGGGGGGGGSTLSSLSLSDMAVPEDLRPLRQQVQALHAGEDNRAGAWGSRRCAGRTAAVAKQSVTTNSRRFAAPLLPPPSQLPLHLSPFTPLASLLPSDPSPSIHSRVCPVCAPHHQPSPGISEGDPCQALGSIVSTEDLRQVAAALGSAITHNLSPRMAKVPGTGSRAGEGREGDAKGGG
jgi:hypothetical protein